MDFLYSLEPDFVSIIYNYNGVTDTPGVALGERVQNDFAFCAHPNSHCIKILLYLYLKLSEISSINNNITSSIILKD